MPLRRFIALTISTCFFIGYLPLIPGTFGSLAGFFMFYLVRDNPLAQAFLVTAVIALGFLTSASAERIFGRKDPGKVVIDEAAGMLLGFLFIPYSFKIMAVGFLTFRIFDTLKVYPANRLQDIKGSVGIMSDDLVAGVYTNIVLQVVLRLASFSGS